MAKITITLEDSEDGVIIGFQFHGGVSKNELTPAEQIAGSFMSIVNEEAEDTNINVDNN